MMSRWLRESGYLSEHADEPVTILALDIIEEFLTETDPPGVREQLANRPVALIELAAHALAQAIVESPESATVDDVIGITWKRAVTIARRWIEEDHPPPSIKIVWNRDKQNERFDS